MTPQNIPQPEERAFTSHGLSLCCVSQSFPEALPHLPHSSSDLPGR